jgi:hypothetical protein
MKYIVLLFLLFSQIGFADQSSQLPPMPPLTPDPPPVQQPEFNLLDILFNLQNSYLKQVVFGKKESIPLSDPSVKRALRFLNMIEEKQVACGGILNKRKRIDVNENGVYLTILRMLEEILTQQDSEDLKRVQAMIYGGKTRGLLSFFRQEAWNEEEGYFYGRGKISESGEFLHYPGFNSEAVGASIYLLTTLGQPFLDKAHPFGTAWQLWQKIKESTIFDQPVRILEKKEKPLPKPYGPAIILTRCLQADYKQIWDSEDAQSYARFLQIDHDVLLEQLVSDPITDPMEMLWMPYLTHNYNIFVLGGEMRSLGFDGSIPECQ